MTLILFLAIILFVEHFTQKSALEIINPILKKIFSVIEWLILFLLGMNEPRGEKS